MFFKKLEKTDFEKIKSIISGKYENSESSLTSMYIWQHYYNSEFCVHDGVLYTIYDKHAKIPKQAFMPYCDVDKMEQGTDLLLDLFDKEYNTNLTINLATENYLNFLLKSKKYNVKYTEIRDSFDYVYNVSDLINLNGRKYHTKKNHFNAFTAKFDYQYVRYNSLMYDKCIDFCSKVVSERTGDNTRIYNSEMESIIKAFEAYKELGLVISLIMINNEIAALSVSEKLTDNCALVHVEKASYDYRDAYPVINKLTLENEFSNLQFVNREEDLGIPGLRKAKMSYRPCRMLKKYKIEFLDN